MIEFEVLPPFVAPENQKLIDNAEGWLRDHERHLRNDIEHWIMSQPGHFDNPDNILEALRVFEKDSFRNRLVSHLNDLKIAFEGPRYAVRADSVGWLKRMERQR